MKIKSQVANKLSTSHLFQHPSMPMAYVAYHEGEFWVLPLVTGWSGRQAYTGNIDSLQLCTWVAAATMNRVIPFKVRALPIDREHIKMSAREVIRRYGVEGES